MAKFKTILTTIILIILIPLPIFATNTTKTNTTTSETITQSTTQSAETQNTQTAANQGTPISSVSSINSPVNPTVLGISEILNIILIAIGIVIIFLAIAIFSRLKK